MRVMLKDMYVSISGEKPIPWRQRFIEHIRVRHTGFNLRREANPLATPPMPRVGMMAASFNLRREANPLATAKSWPLSLL